MHLNRRLLWRDEMPELRSSNLPTLLASGIPNLNKFYSMCRTEYYSQTAAVACGMELITVIALPDSGYLQARAACRICKCTFG
jgi:hypothetical protein